MAQKRLTIYDIAKELGIAASAVSKALNNQKGVSKEVKQKVLEKAAELNYKHNSHAANLRRGKSRTIGVIVPHLDQSFFSETIAGIEEACYENHHHLVICQSHNSYQKESQAIQTLIQHNVDCILISISSETTGEQHLQEILDNNIHLVQFDRCLNTVNSDRVINDNKEASFKAIESLVKNGYRRIGFMGGPPNLENFKARKEGYLEALGAFGLEIGAEFIREDILSRELSYIAALNFLQSADRPDAIFTVSDLQALSVLKAAESLRINVPGQLGVFGFANEAFGELLSPSLSSVDQKSKELGYQAANLYLTRPADLLPEPEHILIECELVLRASSQKHK